jgi:1-acyl-sn-glycerol-3-phosphate acyltransferase
MSSILRFVCRGLLLIAFMLLPLFPTLMLINHYRAGEGEESQRKADRVATRLARRLAWFFGMRIKISGTPIDGAVLFAANHISFLDVLVLYSARAMGFVAKAEIDGWPVFGYAARTGETIFHQRGCHNSAADVIEAMIRHLRAGRAVTIFPEGGIKPGTAVRVFHARMFRAAVDAGCPVQPVSVRYMRDGKIDEAVYFREGENMGQNLLRQLARPVSIVEVDFLPAIDAGDKPRRLLAESARAAVVESIGR